jgi:hypothetical protein
MSFAFGRHLACQHLKPLLQAILLSVKRFEQSVNPPDLASKQALPL